MKKQKEKKKMKKILPTPDSCSYTVFPSAVTTLAISSASCIFASMAAAKKKKKKSIIFLFFFFTFHPIYGFWRAFFSPIKIKKEPNLFLHPWLFCQWARLSSELQQSVLCFVLQEPCRHGAAGCRGSSPLDRVTQPFTFSLQNDLEKWFENK